MKPNDYALVIVALGYRGVVRGDWLYADEVRGGLKWLGFDVSGQLVAARLRVMCEEDAPRFERRKQWPDSREWQYRATHFAVNGLTNRWPGLHGVRS